VIGGLLEHRYRVDGVLARGGMSTVYRGVDTRLERSVAIKVMDPQFSADRAFVARFEREARAAAQLGHPGIVAVHDQGVDRAPDGDHVFLVMELVDGGTLRDLLGERARLSPALALSILSPVLSALAAAHQAGLVHRDVKPENVLIGQGGVVKVGDFGLVRAVGSANTTSDTMILGTVAYLSPEQVATGDSDARSDVYAAGVVLYEMLTGVPPYTGDTPISVAYRHVNDDVPRPGLLVPEIPAELDELVIRATRRDPSLRPANAAAFLTEVERLRHSLSIPLGAVPVPTPGQADKTVRVLPVRIEPSPDLTLPVLPLNPAAPPSVTLTGGPSGPQGTRAMSRTQFTRAPFEQAPPQPAAKKPVRREPKKTAAEIYEEERKRNKRRFTMWIGIILVLAVLIGLAAWWMGSGRWTAVPSVVGLTEDVAVAQIDNAALKSTVGLEASDTVPKGRVLRTEPQGDSEALRGELVRVIVSRGKPVVPQIQPGIEVAAAQKEIDQVGLKSTLNEAENAFSDRVPAGKVVTLKPAPGTEVQLGVTVTVIVSKGAAPKPVPNVEGKTKNDAFAELTAAGFEPFEAKAEFSATVDGGKVIRTDPAEGTSLNAGSKRVGVILSTAVVMPDVQGRKVKDAKKTLEDLGLKVDLQVNGRSNATVINQSPQKGTRIEKGTKVTLIAL
jgi:serine/threonine-protein kinase